MEEIIFSGKIPDVSVEQLRRDTDFSMSRHHFHSTYEVYYLLDGERNYFIHSNAYRIHRGSLVFIGSGQIHKTTMARTPAHERILLEISESLVRELSEGFHPYLPERTTFSERSGVLELTDAEQKETERLLFQIMHEMESEKPAYFQKIKALIEELLIFILRKSSSLSNNYPALRSAKHQKVNEVANYICTNFAEITSLDQLSRHFYISKYYLCRIFKDVTGMTISQYVNANRIKAAEKMLLESSQSVIGIAAASGFESVTYFEKIFRESLGFSPAQYRKLNRNMGKRV